MRATGFGEMRIVRWPGVFKFGVTAAFCVTGVIGLDQGARGQGYPYPWGPEFSLVPTTSSAAGEKLVQLAQVPSCEELAAIELRQLAATYPDGAIRIARSWLSSKDPSARIAALSILEWLGPDAQAALPDLEAIAREDLPLSQRVLVVRVAGMIGDSGNSLLLSALADPSEKVVLSALRAVFRRSSMDREVSTYVAKHLSNTSEQVRYWAALCCWATRGAPGDGLDALTVAAEDSSSRVRYWAKAALSEHVRRVDLQRIATGGSPDQRPDDVMTKLLLGAGEGRPLILSGRVARLISVAMSDLPTSSQADREHARSALFAHHATIRAAILETLEFLVRNPDDSDEVDDARRALVDIAAEYREVIEEFLLRKPRMPIGPDTFDNVFVVVRGFGAHELPTLVRALWSAYPPIASEALVELSLGSHDGSLVAPLVLERVRDENAITCWIDSRSAFPRIEDDVSRIRRYHSCWERTRPEIPPYRIVESCFSKLRKDASAVILEYLDDESRVVRRAAARMLCAAQEIGFEGLLSMRDATRLRAELGTASYARLLVEHGGWESQRRALTECLANEPRSVVDSMARDVIELGVGSMDANVALDRKIVEALDSRFVDLRWLAASALLRAGGCTLLTQAFRGLGDPAIWQNDVSGIADLLLAAKLEQRVDVRQITSCIASLYWDGRVLARVPELVRRTMLERFRNVEPWRNELEEIAENDREPGVTALAKSLLRDG